uniref:Uncharacterized protein n=1 Tax=Laticauda laticaudata TaxID=8630 RepID=A0A8C5S0D1_LATLA
FKARVSNLGHFKPGGLQLGILGVEVRQIKKHSLAMVWEGLNVGKTGRAMLGESHPADFKPVGRNIIYGRGVLWRVCNMRSICGSSLKNLWTTKVSDYLFVPHDYH